LPFLPFLLISFIFVMSFLSSIPFLDSAALISLFVKIFSLNLISVSSFSATKNH
jgi:hypothetical protein